MHYLPVFLRLRSRPVVVVGGGKVAARKVRSLLRAGAQVTLIAPLLEAQLASRAGRGELRHIGAAFCADHLRDAVAVIAATDDAALNAAVSQAARERRIPVNVVDDPRLSTFIFPAIIDRSPILVAVGSSGHAPVLARSIRARIEALLPTRLGALARFMGARRRAVQSALPASTRRRFGERVASGPAATRVLTGDEPGAARAYARELVVSRRRARRATGVAEPGEVYLVGAGPGDPDLLTLRALQLLQHADVVLYDRLVSAAVLERARRDAELIFVGKAPGDRGQQEYIHELLLRHALAGKRVVRLKGGDPLVFGRGGEELEVLAARGIPCTVVPGVTAALAAAATAALPLTHRRLAHCVSFVNGHQGDPGALPDWRFCADPRHTVVFYMGLGHLAGIVARLRASGAAPDHPATLVSQATLPRQQIVRGTLADIVARVRARAIVPPALLIIGNVAALGNSADTADFAVAVSPAAAAAGAPA